MFALRIEYLTGRAVATEYNDRGVAEWPPHPARVFSALVAEWAEGGRDPDEREALGWLERQPLPAICASDATQRTVAPVFVPVNDPTAIGNIDRYIAAVDAAEAELATLESRGADARALSKARKAVDKARTKLDEQGRAAVAVPRKPPTDGVVRAGMKLLPQHRVRQPRTFPSVRPDDPVVHLVWDTDTSDTVREALGALARRVARIGHSSSLVACTVVHTAPPPRWVPDPDGPLVLRWVDQGQVERLDAAYDRHQGVEPRVLPARFARYRSAHARAARELPRPVLGDDWIVFRRISGPRLPPWRAVDVASALRGALMRYADQPPRPILTGHGVDGKPLDEPHVAFVALPWMAHEHADGRILGAALVLPRDVSDADRTHVLRAIGRWEADQPEEDDPGLPLQLGRAGVLRVERVDALGRQTTLLPNAWCRPSRFWVSATPVALDRNPGDLRSHDPAKAARALDEAEATIRAACVHIGLPEPVGVAVSPRPPLRGAAPVKRHPPFPRGDGKLRRVQVHVRLEFAEEVSGPLLLGAGRYLGLGLLRPTREEG